MGKAITVVLALLSAVTTLPAAKKALEFKTGKILDIGVEGKLMQGTTIRRALFTVQIEDIIYTARGDELRTGILGSFGDSGKEFIVGDPVQAAVDGESLILIRPDGKQLKTAIIKRARQP